MLRICARARPHFSDLLDGQLPPLHTAEVAVHAYLCPWCRPLFKSLQATQQAVRALRYDEPPADR
jgi:hypothetical protein